MRGSHLSNIGGYAASIVPLRKGLTICTGVYRVPAAHFQAHAVLSNTMCTIPYRSAGRPEATYLMERLCDLAADQTGIDRISIRRRNLIAPKELPYRTALGTKYDNGEYEQAMDTAIAISEWKEFAKRRRESRKHGKLRGIGLANYIECTMGYPREWSKITVKPDGEVEVAIGTLSSGQGHETSFAQCVSEWLAVPFEQVNCRRHRYRSGRRRLAFRRSMRCQHRRGTCSNPIIARGKCRRAHAGDRPRCRFQDGRFRSEPSQRSFDVRDCARRAEPTISTTTCAARWRPSDQPLPMAAIPMAVRCARLRSSPTPAVVIVRYSAVGDVSRAVNPMILHGQTHGAIAQGVGQALWEHCIVDPDSGQVLTGSFMDYAMPRADVLPSFRTELMEVLSPSNPLGVRAGGEGGTTPALGAVVNAVVDALRDYGVTYGHAAHLEKSGAAIRDGMRQG
jgi:carbon-monoxide dehydrogenase large subunit